MDDRKSIKDILEGALLIAGEPLPAASLARMFDPALDAGDVTGLLEELRDEWAGRHVALVEVAGGWRFQGTTALQPFVDRLSPEKPPRYSRAVIRAP